MTGTSLATKVRELRKAAGMTQSDVAQALEDMGMPGMWPQTITKIEAGTRDLKFVEGLALAKVLEVDPGALVELTATDLAARRVVTARAWLSAAVDDLAVAQGAFRAAQTEYDAAVENLRTTKEHS